MLDWILDNKEWIFSGVGITIILIVRNIIIGSRNKKEEQINRITQRYVDILDSKIPGHAGIIGLIESGAAQLSKNRHIIRVCEIIAQHGKPNPLSHWVMKYIDRKELLKFIKWQANNKINFSYYFNEKTFAELIQKYKEEYP